MPEGTATLPLAPKTYKSLGDDATGGHTAGGAGPAYGSLAKFAQMPCIYLLSWIC